MYPVYADRRFWLWSHRGRSVLTLYGYPGCFRRGQHRVRVRESIALRCVRRIKLGTTHPLGADARLHAPVTVERAHLFGVSVPPAVADAVHRLTPQEPSEEEAAVPLLTRVTYGEVSAGYSETTKAESLTAGETYALLVFETSGEAGGIHFSPSGG